MTDEVMTPLELAIKFHETYERLAPQFGYETRTETRKFDPESANGKLMVAVCGEILEKQFRSDIWQARAQIAETQQHDLLEQCTTQQQQMEQLRRQNHEHAEKRDKEHAFLQSRVAFHDRASNKAFKRMEHAAVDWTTDPPSQLPGGWWRYTSANNIHEVKRLVEELDSQAATIARQQQEIADLQIENSIYVECTRRATKYHLQNHPDCKMFPDGANAIEAIITDYERLQRKIEWAKSALQGGE